MSRRAFRAGPVYDRGQAVDFRILSSEGKRNERISASFKDGILTSGVSLIDQERDLRRRATPTGFRTRGLDFVKAADILLADHYAHLLDQKTRTPSSTVYYNYVHGIELLLKSYLLHTGTSIEDVEEHVRQDVDEALARCINAGLRKVCPELDEIAQAAIVAVSEPYWRKRFEYLRVEGLHLPHVGQVAEAAHALVAGLRFLKMERWQSLSTD